MKQFFLNILSWIQNTFFVKDVVPTPTPQPVPTPLAPAPEPTPPKPTKLDLWIKYITIMEGDKPSRNNPGSLRFMGQPNAVNDGGFCKFNTLENGINALKSLLVNACSGKSKTYHPDMTLLEFQKIYSPSSDNNNPLAYANFVARGISTVYPEVNIQTPIKYLIT
jgi:hypothetical protein